MRILLWLLLALNGVVAAAWLSGFRLPAPARPEPAPPALAARRLELLSELPSLPPRVDAQADLEVAPAEPETPADAAIDAAPAADAGLPAQPAPEDPAPETADRASDTPPPADAPPSGDTPPEPAAAPGQAAAGAPEAPSASADNPDRAPPGSPADSVATLPPASSTAAADAAPGQDAPVCHRTAALAPAARDTAGAALREAKLGEPVLSSSQRPRYWVYWSGAPGDAAAVEAALKAAGVKDWYRAGGAGQATISLGVYGQVEGARRRQRELASKSVQARVEPRYGPQARLRWEITATPSAVAAVADQLARAGVRLEPCR